MNMRRRISDLMDGKLNAVCGWCLVALVFGSAMAMYWVIGQHPNIAMLVGITAWLVHLAANWGK